MIMHSEIMNDRLKGFPLHDDVDEFAVMIMTMIMIVTIIKTNFTKRYNWQANEKEDDV